MFKQQDDENFGKELESLKVELQLLDEGKLSLTTLISPIAEEFIAVTLPKR
jgi:hypothetical protein